MPNFVGESYDHEVFRNAVGLFGEVADMIWLNELYPGMLVKWHDFEPGDINRLPDNICGRTQHSILDSKTNEQQYKENFLMLNATDLRPDRARDHWIFTHHYIESERLGEWKFRCLAVITTGWCIGWEARAAIIPEEHLRFPTPDAKNISQWHEVLKPMHELRRLIRLREHYGLAEGDERWRRGERI